MDDDPSDALPLRERKRRRTRAALVDAGRRLFEAHGYDATTVADVAAAADVSTRTFFAYFASKEELLFPEADGRVALALAAIRGRTAVESPADVLVRALDDVLAIEVMADPLARLRLRLVEQAPAVRSGALRRQLDAEQEIAAALADAYPDRARAAIAALVAAFVSATTAAVREVSADGADGDRDRRRAEVRAAVAYALGRSGD